MVQCINRVPSWMHVIVFPLKQLLERFANGMIIIYYKQFRFHRSHKCCPAFECSGPVSMSRGVPLFSAAGEINFVFISILLLHWFLCRFGFSFSCLRAIM